MVRNRAFGENYLRRTAGVRFSCGGSWPPRHSKERVDELRGAVHLAPFGGPLCAARQAFEIVESIARSAAGNRGGLLLAEDGAADRRIPSTAADSVVSDGTTEELRLAIAFIVIPKSSNILAANMDSTMRSSGRSEVCPFALASGPLCRETPAIANQCEVSASLTCRRIDRPSRRNKKLHAGMRPRQNPLHQFGQVLNAFGMTAHDEPRDAMVWAPPGLGGDRR